MSFGDDVSEPPPEADPERGDAIALELAGHDAALCRALAMRLGLPAPSVVRLGLLALARPGGRHGALR